MIEKIENIVLIGTSHISKESKSKIIEAFNKYNPELICLELDNRRFKTLMNNQEEKKLTLKEKIKMIKEYNFSVFLFYIFASKFQNKMSKKTKSKIGIDMKSAYETAKKNNIPINLIDIPIERTLKLLSKIPLKEKIKMFLNLLKLDLSNLINKKNRKTLNFDITKIPPENLIYELLHSLKEELFPLYNILIEKRNKYMVKKLIKLREIHKGNILVVVGAGHVPGMKQLLEKELTSNVFEMTIKIKQH